MTYRDDCGGQKFFRNKPAKQGGFQACGSPATSQFPEEPPCVCGGQQNSHQKLLSLFGPGTSLIGPPTAMINFPAANATLGATITGLAGSKRGVEKVEMYLNGRKYGSVAGAAFGAQGQQNPASYQFSVPQNLPNSIYDIELKAYDDLGAVTTSSKVTVFKGPPAGCASADTCLTGQKCENGRCFFEPAAGEVGDACSYNEFCKSNTCAGTADQQICTQECIPGTADSCPLDSGLTCIESSPGHGLCFFAPDEGGCCSVGPSSTAWIPGGIGALLFGLIVLRPRRRRA